ncbi:MAG: PTS sugar transporter subunit IIC, partial [Limisphaerales bacterium]
MHPVTAFMNQRLVPVLTVLSENTYLSAIRAGMVSVVPLTIIGGFFMILSYLPVTGWDELVKPYLKLLAIPVTATFGLLAVFVCFAIGYDLGKRLKQEAIVSASIATVVFLMLQLDLEEQALTMDNLGSKGLFTAILVALLAVTVQKLFTDWNLVIKLPASVPPVVYESFLSLSPLFFLILVGWLVRFVAGVDINHGVQTLLSPLVLALNTLPGILVYAFLVAAVFLHYLAANVEAMTLGQPLPYITAYGFFTAFVNVGGTGATIALALIMWNSKEPGFRKISRISMPTQVFQINEPIFFGFPIVLNPGFMIPEVINAVMLTTGTYLLREWGLVN